MGALTKREVRKRAADKRTRNQMALDFTRAFREMAMNENATLIVWTKGQMRGVRAVIKRLGMGKCNGDLP